MKQPTVITIEVEYAADAGEDVGGVGRAFHEIVTEQEGVERAKVYVGYQQELVAGEPDEADDSQRYELTFSVPVVAVVNLETGEVEEVVVQDDLPTPYNEPDENATPEQRERWRRAVELADNGQNWPAWQFGW